MMKVRVIYQFCVGAKHIHYESA